MDISEGEIIVTSIPTTYSQFCYQGFLIIGHFGVKNFQTTTVIKAFIYDVILFFSL